MSLEENDNDIYQIINNESKRQSEVIELIASENYVSRAVMEAQGSCLTNKYAEGYPSKRYYGGCVEVDKAENLALERVKKLFNCSYANVQPHSGSQANQAVFMALLDPMDTILTMDLNSGGHLTHGSPVNLSGKWFKPIHYGVDKTTFRINYDDVEELALKHKPRLIIAGYSCYSRQIDFARFRNIADKVGAYLMGDIAHFAGIIAAGEHPPIWPYAHVATSTTHKTLRGPRGGIILSNDEELGKKFHKAIFPGIQGGPLMHVIAAKAVAFKEALTPEYKTYIKQLVRNAKVLGETLIENGYDILTGGTENHMVTIDLRNKGINGKDACNALVRAGLNCNKNSIPFDTASPFITSGVRLGTPACTTRGFKEEEFILVGKLVAIVLDGLANNPEDNSEIEQAVLADVKELMKKFPIYERENGKVLIND